MRNSWQLLMGDQPRKNPRGKQVDSVSVPTVWCPRPTPLIDSEKIEVSFAGIFFGVKGSFLLPFESEMAHRACEWLVSWA